MRNWKRNFLLLSVGQALSMLTSSILQISIIWYLTRKTGSPIVVTMSTLAGFLPRAVLGLFSGVFIDRLDRKKILIFSDLTIALAALVLAAVALGGELPIWLIFVVLCIRSAGAAFHGPTLTAVVPGIVPQEELTRCAGITQGFESVSLLLSPAFAAMLLRVWSLSSIVLLDVGGALVAITVVALLPIPRYVQGEKQEGIQVWQDMKDGLSVLRGDRGLMAIMVISTLYAFIYFPIGSMYPLITMTYFGGSEVESSIVEMVFSGGTLLGAFLLSTVANKLTNKLSAIALSIGVYGLGVLAVGLLPPSGFRSFVAISAVMGLTIPFFYGLRTAIFQSRVPAEYLGRVMSFAISVSLFSGPIGLLFGGSFSSLLGVNICFALCGALAIGLAIAMRTLPAIRHSKV